MPVVQTLEKIGHYCYFALRTCASVLSALRSPAAVLTQFYNILLGALPLGIVAGMALGVVVWIHLRGAIGPEYVRKVPEYLALAVVVEFAPLSAGLIIAGRTGASLGAELGSMRLTEQIEALEVLGQSPMDKLVGPRVLACMLTLPILTILITYISISSSYIAEMMGGTLSWTQYWTDVLRSLTLARAIPATLKTIVFGFLVGVTGCFYGMNASGGTEGVGKATTQSVVVSIYVVLVANVLLVKIIQVFFG